MVLERVPRELNNTIPPAPKLRLVPSIDEPTTDTLLPPFDPVLEHPINTPLAERSPEFISFRMDQAMQEFFIQLSPQYASYAAPARMLSQYEKHSEHPFSSQVQESKDAVFARYMIEESADTFYSTTIAFFRGADQERSAELVDFLGRRQGLAELEQAKAKDGEVKQAFNRSALGTMTIVSRITHLNLEKHKKRYHVEIWFREHSSHNPRLLEAFTEFTSSDTIASMNRHIESIIDQT